MLAAMKTNHNKLSRPKLHAAGRFLRWCWLPLCIAVLWTGCKQEAKVAADTNPVGTYTLVSVDGNKVPCAVKHDGKEGLTVKSGAFVINADGTCSSQVTFTTPAGKDASREVKATYTQAGAKLTMKWEGAGMTTGTIDGNNFTMDNEGMIFAYRK